MDIQINITSFEVEVKAVVRNDDIKGFVTWYFNSDLGRIKITGGRIMLKTFGKNDEPRLSYDGPAIKAGYGKYYKVFYLDNKEVYLKMCQASVEKYLEVTGELPNDVIFDMPDDYDYSQIEPDTKQ